MATNPITVPLPGDLPENWQLNEIVAPEGSDAGLSEQHGYNYLMECVNNAHVALNEIGEAFSGLATLSDLDGTLKAVVQVSYNGG